MIDHLRTQLAALARQADQIGKGLAETDRDGPAVVDLAKAVVEADRLAAKLEKIRRAVAGGRPAGGK
jgi:hypothetical protein